MQENEIDSFDELAARADAAVTQFNGLGDSIKAAEQRMQEIAALKKHIINYSKTREVYVAYRKAGYSKNSLRGIGRPSRFTRRRRRLLNSSA